MMYSSELHQQIRWVLKEKYHWNDAQILDFFASSAPIDIAVQADIDRLKAGEPVQYVIGWVDFLGTRINLDHRPLIPRPETEYWVEQVISSISKEQKLEVLDLCCGSGCIGIALLKHLPNIHVDFADISEKALLQTAKNLEHNGISEHRYRLIRSTLFKPVDDQTFTQYDLICTNPPYVDPAGNLSPELSYEPAEALFAQNRGFALIEQIISDLKNHLKPQGVAYLEFGEDHADLILKKGEKEAIHVDILNDQFHYPRYARFSLP